MKNQDLVDKLGGYGFPSKRRRWFFEVVFAGTLIAVAFLAEELNILLELVAIATTVGLVLYLRRRYWSLGVKKVLTHLEKYADISVYNGEDTVSYLVQGLNWSLNAQGGRIYLAYAIAEKAWDEFEFAGHLVWGSDYLWPYFRLPFHELSVARFKSNFSLARAFVFGPKFNMRDFLDVHNLVVMNGDNDSLGVEVRGERKMEVETFQVLTPEVLQKIAREWPTCAVEFNVGSVFVYFPCSPFSLREIDSFVQLYRFVRKEVVPGLQSTYPSVHAMKLTSQGKGI